ncbi:MAG: GAF domain-containing protein [Cyanobacteriota bacterium]|nr:GAF domain-containing protein [Cyanobacteriota bacterium]
MGMTERFDKGYALLIGVGECNYKPFSLPVTVKDTQAIYEALIDSDLCAYPDDREHIRVLNNEKATRSAILDGLKWLKEKAEAEQEATVLVYYSGHGWLDQTDGRYYLVQHDVICDPNAPYERWAKALAASALSAEDFTEALRQIECDRLLIVIDSCHAAGMAPSKNAKEIVGAELLEQFAAPSKGFIEALKEGRGRVVFTSCRDDEKSHWFKDQSMSIYTYHFIEALRGAANRLRDTTVRVTNLIEHLDNTVSQTALKECQKKQTPHSEMGGNNFVIAKLWGGEGWPDILDLRASLRKSPEDIDSLLSIFTETIDKITLKIKRILNAHRATIFFFDELDEELWSLVTETNNPDTPEINIPIDRGFAGKTANTKELINIKYDVHEHPDSSETQKQDKLNGYRTYTLLSFPIKDAQDNLIAVIQFLNKLNPNFLELPKTEILCESHIDKQGFTEVDERLLKQVSPQIREVLEEFYSYYNLAYKIEMSQKRIEFTHTISEDKNQDRGKLLQSIMEATRKPVNAHRCTLWELDSKKKKLRTTIHNDGQRKPRKLSLDLEKNTSAIAVRVALSNEPMNIEYDLYEREDNAEVAKKLDKENKYRTCSLLCMPVRNTQGDVIGVTQLVNKTRRGNFPDYDPTHHPTPPTQWKASFSRRDERRMKELNIQIAEVLGRASISEIDEQNRQLIEKIKLITRPAAESLHANRGIVFFLNEEKTQLWSPILNDEQGESLETVQIAIGEGLAGEAAQSQKIQKVDRDFHCDPRSSISNFIEPGFRIENAAAVPIISPDRDEIIAIIEFWNHIDLFSTPRGIEKNGFNRAKLEAFQSSDSQRIAEYINSFLKTYHNVQSQRIINMLHKAQNLITEPGLTSEDKFVRIMEAARDMASAHRITLWLIDGEHLRGQTIDNKEQKRLREIPINNNSIVGETTLTGKIVNIPFDIYEKDDRRSQTAKAFDQQLNYRTCSLLCVPIYARTEGIEKLVGILQLVNKVIKNQLTDDGDEKLSYSRVPPKQFHASFDNKDEQNIEEFCGTAGRVLYEILLKKEFKKRNQRP